MRSRIGIGATLLMVGIAAAACGDEIPTGSEPGLIPVEATTVEVILDFDDFADDFRVDGGYGSAVDLGVGIVARDGVDENADDLVTIVRFGAFPASVGVSTGPSAVEVDTLWTAIGGELVVVLDTTRAPEVDNVDIVADRLTESFHALSASWMMAADTLGEQRAWSVPGGGLLDSISAGAWFPSLGDTLTLSFDSTTAAAFSDPDAELIGVRLRTSTDGAYLRVLDTRLFLSVRPSLDPDTIIVIEAMGGRGTTTLSSAEPEPGDDTLVIGGAPAFRSSFRFNLPPTVDASGPGCGGAASCTFDLHAEDLVYAGIVLRSEQVPDRILVPRDTVLVEIRPVLAPGRLPRSPLGFPVLMEPYRLPPSAFDAEGAIEIELAVTRYLRDLLSDSPPGGAPIPDVITLLTAIEPMAPGIALFGGRTSTSPPKLRLILTRSSGVSLP